MAQGPIRSGLADDAGVVAVLSGLLLTAMFGMAALAIDIGLQHATKRSLQSAVDVTALSASYPVAAGTGSPQAMAATYFADAMANTPMIAHAALGSVTEGTYCPDSTLAVAARFIPGAATCANIPTITGPNAVQVDASVTQPFIFGRVLGATARPIAASATASQINEAGFFAGTGLLAVNGGVINAVLSSLLGSSINLTAVQYQALLNTNIDALGFLNALATNIGVTTGTYSSLLATPVDIQQVLQAEITALNQPGSVAAVALSALISQIAGAPQVNLGQVFDLGVWQNVGLNSVQEPAALTAGLNLYQLASIAVQVANGQHFLTLNSPSISVPGIAQVSLATTAIEPPQSPYFAFGPAGVSVHTAQVRTQLTLSLLNTGSLLGGLLSGLANVAIAVPLYVEVASGAATLRQISCGTDPANDATVTIDAAPAAITAYLGQESQTDMTNFANAVPAPGAATILTASLLGTNVLTVTGAAMADVGSPDPTSLVFTQAQMQASPPATQTTSSTEILSTLSSDLSSSLVLNVAATGLGLTIPAGTLVGDLTGSLTPVFQATDGLIDPLLAALGVRVGTMDVTATGVRCGVPALVD
ncbi:MAG: hypothetical protein KGL12_02350 [Rhodospirillales bacterium]|nr:hypothetical protein [Rhodospirillales bacterium]